MAIANQYPGMMRYIKMDALVQGKPIQWRGQSHSASPAPIWITGHADQGVDTSIYPRYKENCLIWFTVNKEYPAPNLHALPLGITNDCNDSDIHPIYGNLDVMVEVMNTPRLSTEFRGNVYMNFSRWTYPAERNYVWNLFADKEWVTKGVHIATLQGRKEFLHTIRNHRFVLAPRGNGVDTHRLWEALYMGSIPIVKRHLALDEFQDLPIAWINDWSEVTPAWLDETYARMTDPQVVATYNMDKLRMSYWKSKITAAMKSLEN